MKLLKKAEQFIERALKKAKNINDLTHSQKTVYWIRQLKPDADEALLIAGALHDIERAFNGDWKAGTSEIKALKKHQNMSADEAEKFLRKERADNEIIGRVKHLISAHEMGGDNDQNILCDADCLAWLEDKAIRNIEKHKAQGKLKKEMKEKLDYLMGRISTEKAKKIAQKWYKEALKELKKVDVAKDIEVRKSRINGKGVFALRNFQKGEVVLMWKPKLIKKSEIKLLSSSEKTYITQLGRKYLLMQSPEKYVNHSCNANTTVKDCSDVAVKQIKKGEEITSDYIKTKGGGSFKCKCGSKNCRKTIY